MELPKCKIFPSLKNNRRLVPHIIHSHLCPFILSSLVKRSFLSVMEAVKQPPDLSPERKLQKREENKVEINKGPAEP